ncbi:hypothetical protein [Teredinibacter turnerae]
MKTHIGADSRSKLIHSVLVTSPNVHSSQVIGDLFYGADSRCFGESA